MNIFEAEKAIKNINMEEPRFPRISIDNQWKPVEIKIDKIIDHEIIKVIQKHFEFPNDYIKIIKSVEEELINHISQQIDSWFLGILNEFGVTKEEIGERVSSVIQCPYTDYQRTHIYIDGEYVFSFGKSNGYAKNSGIYTALIKAEYMPEMKDKEI